MRPEDPPPEDPAPEDAVPKDAVPTDAPPEQDGNQGDALGEAWFRDRNVADLHAEAVGEAAGRDEAAARGRLLKTVALIVVLLAGLDVALRQELPPVSLVRKMPQGLGAYYVKLLSFERAETPDVLFLGSSRMARAVDPDVVEQRLAADLGRPLSAFNLGLNNAKLEELSTIVRSYLPDPPPPFVILGFSGTELVRDFEFQYAARFLWTLADAIAYLQRTPAERRDWVHIERYLQQLLGNSWYLYDQRGPLKAKLIYRARDLAGLVDERERRITEIKDRAGVAMAASPKGFWAGDEFSTGRTLAQRLANDPGGVRVPPRELVRPAEILQGTGFPMLRDIIERLLARGCNVALAEVPPSPWLAAKNPVLHGAGVPPSPRHPEGLAGCRTRLAELAADVGIPFVGFDARSSGLTNADYVDGNHMSLPGAKRYTDRLIARLIERDFFERAP